MRDWIRARIAACLMWLYDLSEAIARLGAENMIKNKINYGGGKVHFFITGDLFDEVWGEGNLFHRTDYHEDGSESNYYGIELTEQQYNAIVVMLNKGECNP